MKKVVSILVVMLFLFAIISSSVVVSAAETNVALGKPVESSGYIETADPPESPEKINDGDIDTKWCARVEDNELFDDEGHWIIIDLEKETAISKIAIRQASEGERDFEKYELNLVEYTIEVSNDKKTWEKLSAREELYEDALDGESVENYTLNFDAISIRYFKLTTVQPALTEYTVRLPEIEIYAAAEGAKVVTVQEAANKLQGEIPVATTPPATTPPAATTAPVATTAPAKTTAPVATTAPATTTASTETTESDSDFPIEIVLGIVAGVLVIGGAAFFIIKKKKG